MIISIMNRLGMSISTQQQLVQLLFICTCAFDSCKYNLTEEVAPYEVAHYYQTWLLLGDKQILYAWKNLLCI